MRPLSEKPSLPCDSASRDYKEDIGASGEHGSASWQVYMVSCSDGSLYTGITKDLSRRLQEHATGKGAKYFRGRRPKEVVYLEDFPDRSRATRREMEIKRMSVAEKTRMITSPNNLRCGLSSDSGFA